MFKKFRKKLLHILLFLLFSPGIIFAIDPLAGTGIDLPDEDLTFEDLEALINEAAKPDEREQRINQRFEEGFKAAGIPDIAFWNKTYGARSRDPLFLIPKKRLVFDPDGLSASLFFNSAGKLPVYPDLVFNVNALDLLDEYTGGNNQFSDSELGSFEALFKALPYIRRMTVEERRLGLMLNGGFSTGRFSLQCDTSLLFAERNYWLPDKSARQDLQALLEKFKTIGKGGAYKYRYGLGDTRLKLGYSVLKEKNAQAAIGVSAIIPTSKIFSTSESDIVKSKVGESRNQLMTDLLNVGKHILINPKLGMGYWGLGGFCDFRVTLIPKRLDLFGKISYEHLFSGHEVRFMPNNKKVPFSAFVNLAAEDDIPEGFPINDLFPTLTRVTVSPGDIFNATLGLDCKITNNFQWSFGYDFYLQQKEKIKNVYTNNIDFKDLMLQNAIASQAIQHKVFTELMYTKRGKKRDWHFGIGGDYTFARNRGIATDWTIHGKIGITF